MPDLFKEIIPSILTTKKDVLEDAEGDYVPFVVNKALSFHYDCILIANEMNKNPHLDKKAQYQFLLNRVRAWKRPFQKWQKLAKNDDLELVKEFFQYSNDKAKAALGVLKEDQMEQIRNEMNKGGFHGKSGRINRGDATRT
jgi:hypothetical protein